jgi:hypothetical protein
MTDRELLELAAKASDIHYDMYVEKTYIQGAERTGLWNELWEYCWNPLTDDGDALRLAVKLGVNVQFFTDQYAATRRAIVLAAAEIGKGNP